MSDTPCFTQNLRPWRSEESRILRKSELNIGLCIVNYKCIHKWVQFKSELQHTDLLLHDRPVVSSHSDILPPPSSYHACDPAKKKSAFLPEMLFHFSFYFLNSPSLVVTVLKLFFGNHASHSELHCSPTSSVRLRQDSVHFVRLAFYYNWYKRDQLQLASIYTRHVDILLRTLRTPQQIDFGKQRPTSWNLLSCGWYWRSAAMEVICRKINLSPSSG